MIIPYELELSLVSVDGAGDVAGADGAGVEAGAVALLELEESEASAGAAGLDEESEVGAGIVDEGVEDASDEEVSGVCVESVVDPEVSEVSEVFEVSEVVGAGAAAEPDDSGERSSRWRS